MSTMAVAAGAVPQERAATGSWEKVGNALVLLLYSGIVLFTVRYHEKWADEAQAWLIARDLDLKTIWFHELRYEGSPGLWHTILWIAQHRFHMSYATLGYIGVVFAIAGVAVLVYKSPFPWYIRWPLAFTYVMIYQYAVIARPYTILPLLCFLVAIFFKDAEHPVKMTVVLVLLANLSLHGTVLAGCFGLLYLIQAIRAWPTLDDKLRNRYFICAPVMVCAFLLVFIILRPTPDIEEFLLKQEFSKLSASQKQDLQVPSALKKAMTITSGAFLDYPVLSLLFLFLAAVWGFLRRKFLVVTLPTAMMILLYAFIHGAPHHHGTAFVAFLASIWIAWPNRTEVSGWNVQDRWVNRAFITLLLVLCSINVVDGVVAIKREYLYPYSGAKDAFNYLKAVGADQTPMFGFLFGVSAIQAYFDHNIFANLPATYFHHGLPLFGRSLDVAELQRVQPEYIVAYAQNPQEMMERNIPALATQGYQIVHMSDGYYIYKQAVANREFYFILRRVHPSDEQTPQTLNPDR